MNNLFTLAQLREMDHEYQGGCLYCGAVRDCCEPDARAYDCEECGRKGVYGAAEIILMGRVKDG